MIYSPIGIKDTLAVKGNTITVAIDNKYSFTNLSKLKLIWNLELKGKTIGSGNVTADIPPIKTGNVTMTFPSAPLNQADALRIEFVHPNGNHVVSHRYVLKETPVKQLIDYQNLTELPVPGFNLVTRETEKDNQIWRSITRSTASLTNVAMEPASAQTLAGFKRLVADVVLGAENKVVGKLQAEYTNGEFTYRLEWTGNDVDVQELGWAFNMPEAYDNFSWNRKSRWTDYPEHHTSRQEGTAKPESMNVPVTKMDRVDAFDFNSTKYDCNWASLTTADGKGIRAEFSTKQRYHCRAGEAKDGGYLLFVNRQVSPPDDISSSVVKEVYMKLKAGDILEGSFYLGSNRKP
jgi:hypothetical protein